MIRSSQTKEIKEKNKRQTLRTMLVFSFSTISDQSVVYLVAHLDRRRMSTTGIAVVLLSGRKALANVPPSFFLGGKFSKHLTFAFSFFLHLCLLLISLARCERHREREKGKRERDIEGGKKHTHTHIMISKHLPTRETRVHQKSREKKDYLFSCWPIISPMVALSCRLKNDLIDQSIDYGSFMPVEQKR